MPFRLVTIFCITALASVHLCLFSQVHPKEILGRKVFDSFRKNDFKLFYLSSIFSIEEQTFRDLLFTIKNEGLRNELLAHHQSPFPPQSTSAEQWEIAFAHTWRDQWRHLAHHSPQEVMLQSFTPILREAKENGIQWESTQLLAIEVLLDVKWNNRKFDVERDLMPAENQIDPYTLFLDRKLTYRFRLDKSTHGNAFMIGYAPDDSEQIYSKGILGNGSGQADILARFTTQFPDRLYYFCPFEDDAGGPILIKDFDDTNKPNQRSNILLTFSFGQPQRAYQILIKSVLSTPSGEVFCERPVWLGEVILPRGLNFSN